MYPPLAEAFHITARYGLPEWADIPLVTALSEPPDHRTATRIKTYLARGIGNINFTAEDYLAELGLPTTPSIQKSLQCKAVNDPNMAFTFWHRELNRALMPIIKSFATDVAARSRLPPLFVMTHIAADVFELALKC